jgi:hypothetical protein
LKLHGGNEVFAHLGFFSGGLVIRRLYQRLKASFAIAITPSPSRSILE